jgi:hypothetical protein
MKNVSKEIEIILGVDTHLDIHVGAVISAAGKLLVRAQFPLTQRATVIY